MEVYVTRHAARRMKERLGANKRALLRIAVNAYTRGARYCETTGAMRRYLDKQIEKDGRADCDWRIYQEHLFAFAPCGALVTVIELGKTMKKGVKKRSEKNDPLYPC